MTIYPEDLKMQLIKPETLPMSLLQLLAQRMPEADNRWEEEESIISLDPNDKEEYIEESEDILEKVRD